jgi:hypothetical protein
MSAKAVRHGKIVFARLHVQARIWFRAVIFTVPNPLASRNAIPQGLKPSGFACFCGTTEVVPFQNAMDQNSFQFLGSQFLRP